MFISFRKVIIASVALLTISTFSRTALYAQDSVNELVGTWNLESTEWDTDLSQLDGQKKAMYDQVKAVYDQQVTGLIIVYKEDGTFTRKVTVNGQQVALSSASKIEGNLITTAPAANGDIFCVFYELNDQGLTLTQDVSMPDGSKAKINLYMNN